MPSASSLCLISGLVALGPLSAAAVREKHHDLSLSLADAGQGPPETPDIEACGEAAIKSVGKLLGCGMDGCAWKLVLADSSTAILKVAKDTGKAAQASVKKDCSFANKLEAAGVQNALKCLGSCEAGGNKAAVMSPFMESKAEFGPNPIQLGDKNRHAIEVMLTTAWQMLHGGFINGDQANNVLYNPETGDPVFIDFGRAMHVTKVPKSTMKKRLLGIQVRNMIYDLVIGTVPKDLCGFAREKVHALQKELPPPEVLAIFVEAAMDSVEEWWESKC